MKARYAVLAIAAAMVAMMATSASAIDLSGSYFRTGVGFDSKGGGQACFQLPGTDFKSRLGNECDNYLEISFSQVIKKFDDGTEFYYQFMPAWGLSTNSAPSTGYGYGTGNLYVQQNWGSVKLPQLGGAVIWAGWRYFQRHNIDNLDWFWWNPMQGRGAVGIENVDLGVGKLAFTLGRIELDAASGATSTFEVPDIRFKFQIGESSSVELGIDLPIYNGGHGDVPTVSPWYTAILTLGDFAGGDNTLAFQYASGAGYQMGGGIVYPPTGAGAREGTSQSKQWRILDQLVYHPVPVFSGELALVYQDKDQDDNNGATFFTAQLRPAIHLSDYFKIAADIAYQMESVKHVSVSNPTLWKFTLCPTIVAGQKDGLWARPEIRFFVTYATWSNLLPTTTVANGVFGTETNGLSWGAQMEAWW